MNILVTGGASGLGESITKLLSKDNNNTVYFTFCNSKKKSDEICTDFSNSTSIKCDFNDLKSVNSLCEMIPALKLDVLINNAYGGSAINKYFHKNSIDVFTNDFTTNIIPTILITQSVISYFKKQKKGKIITILTSFLLNSPPIGTSSYVANKAYLKSLTKSWANENKKFNISSNSISPSFMLTNFTSEVDERIIDQIVNDHPLKKILGTSDVAETVAFLVNSSQQINGIDLVINAGDNII
jgi:3-oxoacyl-[acyl-carrier protein] reductase